MKNNQPQKSIAASALLLCYVFVFFFPVLFFIIHTGHDCAASVDTECHVCVKVHNVKNLLKQINRTGTSLFYASAAFLIFAILSRVDEIKMFSVIPLKYKVRLNT